MILDTNDPSGYSDKVAQLAMKDFHNIIVSYENIYRHGRPFCSSSGRRKAM